MVQRLLFVFYLCVLNAVYNFATSTTLKPVCPVPPAQCRFIDSANDEHFFNVEDKPFVVKYAQTYLTLECPDGVSLESDALPRFEQRVRVQEVYLVRCALPRLSYAAALAALNVSAVHKLELQGAAPAPLRAQHLQGLQVAVLFVKARPPLRLAPGALAPLPQLRDLLLERVALDEAALLALPPRLGRLSLSACNVSAVPAAALRRLGALRHLYLREPSLARTPDLWAAPALVDAVVQGPVAELPTAEGLAEVTLWGARGVARRGGCAALRRLSLYGCNATALPPGWLRDCANLTELSLMSLALQQPLPPDLVHAAPLLAHLAASRCRLTSLPPDLLLNSKKLLSLDLSFNRLTELPPNWFASVVGLQTLNLTGNLLTRQSAAAAFALPSLRALRLSGNPLGDLCHVPREEDAPYVDNALSEVSRMRGLEVLELARCGVRRVCADWREELRALRVLDLSGNKVRELGAADLRWRRDVPAEVKLQGNAITRLLFTRQDYEDALKAPAPAQSTRLRLDATLECECAYWAVLVAQSARGGPLEGARCRGGVPLRQVPAAALRCPVPAPPCPPRCRCAVLGPHLEVSCEGVGLERVPALGADLAPARLLLPRNAIAALRPQDFAPNLLFLNLSGNLVSEVDSETAAAMFAVGERRVALAGNPLRCECGGALLAALRAHRGQVADYGALVCRGGVRVEALAPGALCGGAAWGAWGAAAGGGALAALALAAALALRCGRHALLRRLKAFLVERGLCVRWVVAGAGAEAGDAALPYDVFVSFSHHDHAFVAERLVPALEGGARPYRLCLHYRDWAPGAWIPAQIARSVRAARRTLLVVSERWARSQWALLEFREAYAHALEEGAPRLVLLLLDEPEAVLALAPELAPFLLRNTYLRADDRWFWRKLRQALPRPAPPADAADAADAAHTAPSA